MIHLRGFANIDVGFMVFISGESECGRNRIEWYVPGLNRLRKKRPKWQRGIRRDPICSMDGEVYPKVAAWYKRKRLGPPDTLSSVGWHQQTGVSERFRIGDSMIERLRQVVRVNMRSPSGINSV